MIIRILGGPTGQIITNQSLADAQPATPRRCKCGQPISASSGSLRRRCPACQKKRRRHEDKPPV